MSTVRLTMLVGMTLLGTSVVSSGEHRLIGVGDRRLSMDCEGETARGATVVLIAGGGRTAKDWEKVQPSVSAFARVCSYDRAGFGESEKAPVQLQTVQEVVDDLHALLAASGEEGPFVLVAHSIAGIYARSFVTRISTRRGGTRVRRLVA